MIRMPLEEVAIQPVLTRLRTFGAETVGEGVGSTELREDESAEEDSALESIRLEVRMRAMGGEVDNKEIR